MRVGGKDRKRGRLRHAVGTWHEPPARGREHKMEQLGRERSLILIIQLFQHSSIPVPSDESAAISFVGKFRRVANSRYVISLANNRHNAGSQKNDIMNAIVRLLIIRQTVLLHQLG